MVVNTIGTLRRKHDGSDPYLICADHGTEPATVSFESARVRVISAVVSDATASVLTYVPASHSYAPVPKSAIVTPGWRRTK